jgi:hypothetical protein
MVCPHDFQMKTADGKIICLRCKENLRKVDMNEGSKNPKITATPD